MNKIKIGIVEDEMIIVETIVLALGKLGYEIAGTAGTYEEGLEMISKNRPDLVLLDINLGTKKDGIDLAIALKEGLGTPIIFLTANSDAVTIERAKEIQPLAFIVKPFSKNDLFSAIEIGWNNYNLNLKTAMEASKVIVLKVGRTFEKVVLDAVLYFKNDHNYIEIYMVAGKKLLVRYTNSEIIALLPANQFIKINRTYIVNVRHVNKIDSKCLHIAQLTIPIAKEVRAALLQMM